MRMMRDVANKHYWPTISLISRLIGAKHVATSIDKTYLSVVGPSSILWLSDKL